MSYVQDAFVGCNGGYSLMCIGYNCCWWMKQWGKSDSNDCAPVRSRASVSEAWLLNKPKTVAPLPDMAA